ncbi:MAG: glycosyltransferase [Acidimicrobiia bacterium]
MRILYNLPHLNDWLDDERAGHLVRANEMLAGFEANGCTIVHAKPRRRPGSTSTQVASPASTAVGGAHAQSSPDRSVRAMVHRHLPRRLALVVRDSARYAHHLMRCRSLMATVRRERPDAIFETYEVSSFASAVAARRTGVPLIIDDLCPLEEHWDLYGTGSKWVSRRLRRFVLDSASLLVAVNAANAAALRRDGVPDSKIVEVPNGVRADAVGVADAATLERARAIRERLDVGDATLALYVGSFQPFHRVDVLIDAMADPALHDVPLVAVLVGDGDGIEEIRERSRQRGVGDRIRWVGRVPHGHVASYVAAADLGVVAGATENVNPMKIYEYLAGGLPVVAPDIAMVTALLAPGADPERRAGVVFRRDDAHAMAEALATVAGDGDLRAALAAAARATNPATWPERAKTLEERIRSLTAVAAPDPVPSSGPRS